MSDDAPVYDKGRAPRGLLTRRKLAEQGLKPPENLTPDARIRWFLHGEPKPPFAVWHPDRCEPMPQVPDRDQRRADRDAAAEWARTLIADPTAIAVDTETTSKDNPEIIEISAVALDGTRIVDTLVRPASPIEAEASSVHGIYDDDVRGCQDLTGINDWLTERLAGRTIVAWNGQFDQRALTLSYQSWDLPVPDWVTGTWHDAMRQHAAHRGEWDSTYGHYRWHQLSGGHRAAGDCDETWNRIQAMAGNVWDADTVHNILTRIEKAGTAGAYADMTGPDAARAIYADLNSLVGTAS